MWTKITDFQLFSSFWRNYVELKIKMFDLNFFIGKIILRFNTIHFLFSNYSKLEIICKKETKREFKIIATYVPTYPPDVAPWWPVLPLWIFMLDQFYKFVSKFWCACAKSIKLGLEMAEWTRKAYTFLSSFLKFYWVNLQTQHTKPKSLFSLLWYYHSLLTPLLEVQVKTKVVNHSELILYGLL